MLFALVKIFLMLLYLLVLRIKSIVKISFFAYFNQDKPMSAGYNKDKFVSFDYNKKNHPILCSTY
jgi:hypothetical protein